MGELQVGDQVFGADGWPVNITGVHPQGERQVWEVSLQFADPIYCDAEHLWVVTDQPWRKYRNQRGMGYGYWQLIEPFATAELRRKR